MSEERFDDVIEEANDAETITENENAVELQEYASVSDIPTHEEILKEKKAEKRKLKRHDFLMVVLGIFIGIMVTVWGFVGVTYIRYYITLNKLKNQASVTETVELGGEATAKSDEPVVSDTLVSKITAIETLIKQNYYKDVDTQTLADGIFDGMMESLGDPYSEYYSESELEEVKQGTQGIYYGIGAYISIDKETELPVIADVISGTPAEEAHLQADDLIYKVDGKETTGMTTTEVVKLIKGEEHTIVTLTLIRDGEQLDVDVERRKVESPTVEYEMRDNNIGYIRITEFDDVTTDQFTEAKAVLEGQGMQALIIDLRSNGGGNLSTCIAIAQQILPKGLIVYTEDKYGNREEHTCDGKREFDKPLVVLVNGYSASASEILTGAIKDYGIGTIMGTKTYGKGIVQQIIPLRDNTAVKMTISKYFTPKGNYIHETGIEPDIEVEFDSETYKKGEYDNQIEAAEKELLKQLK